jgi:hypothetical protein
MSGIKWPKMSGFPANNEPESKPPTCRFCDKPTTIETSYQDPCPKCLKNEPTTILKRFDEIDRKALKRELRFDDDIEEYVVVNDAIVMGEEWRGYKYEIFGVILGRFSKLNYSRVPDIYRHLIKTPWKLMPFQCVHVKEDLDLMVQLCRIRIFYENDRFYSEMRVHPFGVQRISINGLEYSQTKADLEHVWKGLELLRKIGRGFGGRKKGSTKISLEDFRRRAPEIYCNWLRSFGEHPTDLDIASGLYLSSATFYRYLRSCGWDMQLLRAEAEKRINKN